MLSRMAVPDFQHDQAAGLRRIMAGPSPRVVSVISAASDRNQPRLMCNLAASLFLQGSDVLIVNAAKASREANISYQMPSMPSLVDVLLYQAPLAQAIQINKQGFAVGKLLPEHMVETPLDSQLSASLDQMFIQIAKEYEVVLVDTTLNKNHILPIPALNNSDIIIQLTQEAESIKQAYRIIKQLCNQIGRRPFGILVDGVSAAQAEVVYRNIAQVARRFMQIELEFIGHIPADEYVNKAAKLGRPVIEAFPFAKSSNAFRLVAQRLDSPVDSAAMHQTTFI